jgi:serine/threonine-protein kinase
VGVRDARQDKPAPSMDLVGERVMDRYRIVERVARGGMSVVYRGEDERLRRPVCVKVFCGLDPQRPGYRTVHEHFVQEAFTLSTLRHPNTLRIYDFGYLEDSFATPFFVAEYAEGGTLKDHVRKRGPLALEETLEILEPIAGALREAHEMGIVHRDIKPSNILFTQAGPASVVKLADFSIAKAYNEVPNRADDTNTNSADKVGLYSLGWAAPEQLRGEKVGPTADVFALGLMAAYMLTGKMVYPGEDILLLFEMRRGGDGYLLSTLAEHGLDPRLQDVISAACREDPNERHPTIEAFVDALRDHLEEDWQVVTTRRGRATPIATIEPAAPIAPMAEPLSIAPTHAGAFMEAAPITAVPAAVPMLVVERLNIAEIVVSGRRLRPVPIGEDVVIGESSLLPSRARVRVTARSFGAGGLHLKGLNCFVVRDNGRASPGVDVDRDAFVAFVSPGRELLDAVRVFVGVFDGNVRGFALEGAALAVPVALASWSVVLDLGPGRETVLLYRAGGEP